MGAAEVAMKPLREMGRPIADVIAPHPFASWQAALDPLLTSGMRNYRESHSFTTLSDAAIATLVEYAGRLPSPECQLACAQSGGAINRVSAETTAYPHRNIGFVLNIRTRWRDLADDAECIAWA
jgi:hypothetical protein